MDAYNWVALRVLAPLLDMARRTETCASLQELEGTQWWPEDRLRDLQTRRLKALVLHAYLHVPFYRQFMQEAGVSPSDVSCVSDIALFPVMTRGQVRLARSVLEADVVPVGRIMRSRTGGATGEPLRFTTTTHDVRSRGVARSLRAQSWAGYRPGDRAIGLFEPPRDRSTRQRFIDAVGMGAQRREVMGATDMSPRRLEEVARRLEARPGCFLSGLPSAVYLFALHVERRGGLRHYPKGIVTGGEPLYDGEKEVIERALGVRPLSKYSSAEVLDIASQCGRGDAYHIAAEDVIVEILSDDGRSQPAGVPGRVVVTNLHNYAMPFIRYDLGDVAVLGSRRCPCGRTLPLLERIEGRRTDIVVTPDGRTIPGAALPWCFLADRGARRIQIIQESVDSLTIQLSMDAGLSAEAVESTKLEVRRRYESVLGQALRLDVNVVPDISPGPQAKRAFVVSRVPHPPGVPRRPFTVND
jgi:phenylacetate-CoA ligase